MEATWVVICIVMSVPQLLLNALWKKAVRYYIGSCNGDYEEIAKRKRLKMSWMLPNAAIRFPHQLGLGSTSKAMGWYWTLWSITLIDSRIQLLAIPSESRFGNCFVRTRLNYWSPNSFHCNAMNWYARDAVEKYTNVSACRTKGDASGKIEVYEYLPSCETHAPCVQNTVTFQP